jgi:hypothetical protein
MPFDIRFIDNPTKRIQEVAIRLDPFVIEYIPMIDKIYSKSNKYIQNLIKLRSIQKHKRNKSV